MESGYQTFAENFRQCCGQSYARLAYKHQQTDKEFACAQQECEELYELLRDKLKDEQKLINRFDAAKTRELSFDTAFIYQQGFQDCVYLLRWMGVL